MRHTYFCDAITAKKKKRIIHLSVVVVSGNSEMCIRRHEVHELSRKHESRRICRIALPHVVVVRSRRVSDELNAFELMAKNKFVRRFVFSSLIHSTLAQAKSSQVPIN